MIDPVFAHRMREMFSRSRTKILAALVLMAALILIGITHVRAARPSWPLAEFDCPEPGTVFTYDIISRVTHRPNEFRILGKRDFACRMHSSTFGDYEWSGGISPHHGNSDDLSVALAHDLWPLQVGKHVETQNPWFRIDFDVLSFGRVDVPLGRYEAFEIRKSFWTHDYKIVTTVYWSPRFKWVIKQEEHMVFGTSPNGLNNWALETVSLP